MHSFLSPPIQSWLSTHPPSSTSLLHLAPFATSILTRPSVFLSLLFFMLLRPIFFSLHSLFFLPPTSQTLSLLLPIFTFVLPLLMRAIPPLNPLVYILELDFLNQDDFTQLAIQVFQPPLALINWSYVSLTLLLSVFFSSMHRHGNVI